MINNKEILDELEYLLDKFDDIKTLIDDINLLDDETKLIRPQNIKKFDNNLRNSLSVIYDKETIDKKIRLLKHLKSDVLFISKE